MMLKQRLFHTFVQNLMGKMGRSHNSDRQVSVEKLIPSRLDQTRNKNDYLYVNSPIPKLSSREVRVSVQGVKSFGGHFACLSRGFDFCKVSFFLLLFFKMKMEILLHF